MQFFTLLFAFGVLFSTGNCFCEDLDDSKYSLICHDISQGLQGAFIQDKGNLYRSKRAFFYAPNADPVLLRVKYNITFAENITEELTPYCVDEDNSGVSITLNQTKMIIRGWTSRGLYQRIEPLLLSSIQMTFPFCFLRWIHKTFNSDNPEMNAFLWNGSYNLSTLLINLHITSLPCIPSDKILNFTIEELTTFLKVYASQRDRYVSRALQTEDIGFHLSEKAISNVPPNSRLPFSYFPFFLYFLYDLIGYGLVAFAYLIYIRKNKATPTSYHDNNMLLSIAIIGVCFTFLECIGTLWHIDYLNCMLIIYAGLTYIITILQLNCVVLCHKSKQVGILNMHITMNMAIILCLLPIYHFIPPTFLLLLVYPTKVITTFAYLITALFVGIIICSVYVLSYKDFNAHLKFKNIRLNRRKIFLSVLAIKSIVIVLLFIFYTLVLYPVVYVVMLNQSSSFISPIYTILSLAPSAAMSFITWTFKTKLFHPVSIEELQKSESAEDTTEQRDTNDSNADTEEERIPLLTVEENISASNPMSESSPNLHNRNNYGTADAKDKSRETNC